MRHWVRTARNPCAESHSNDAVCSFCLLMAHLLEKLTHWRHWATDTNQQSKLGWLSDPTGTIGPKWYIFLPTDKLLSVASPPPVRHRTTRCASWHPWPAFSWCIHSDCCFLFSHCTYGMHVLHIKPRYSRRHPAQPVPMPILHRNKKEICTSSAVAIYKYYIYIRSRLQCGSRKPNRKRMPCPSSWVQQAQRTYSSSLNLLRESNETKRYQTKTKNKSIIPDLQTKSKPNKTRPKTNY